MAEQKTVRLDELAGLVGTDIGPSDWMDVDQGRIDRFAAATDDHQWIHTDPDRAKDGPFGTTIAHGFLTLSLFIPLWTSVFDVEGVTTKVNYGLDRVRFTAPVPAGSRVRLVGTLKEVTEVKGGVQLAVSGTIEVEGQERPAVVVDFLARFYA
ncbi:acyl dehydratase [Kineococcus rhizosphaerae]|uniref:Acyl dehydratase n=1 Tax=Kineococcus rhizosphaerae TaxID=559628 RepID=A0A2T0R324_9ACTN|nr:MaoC family dehydratase [Kineococcus rhizosphaerae]PRY14459.1 acyl dehydratase [Kineococcus rhizosphaerae]